MSDELLLLGEAGRTLERFRAAATAQSAGQVEQLYAVDAVHEFPFRSGASVASSTSLQPWKPSATNRDAGGVVGPLLLPGARRPLRARPGTTRRCAGGPRGPGG